MIYSFQRREDTQIQVTSLFQESFDFQFVVP